MSSANVAADPKLCGSMAGWPAGMQELAALRIEEGGSVSRHGADHLLTQAAPNSLNPDAVIIGGYFGGTEHFSVQAMFVGGGGGWTILLQNDEAMWRTRLSTTNLAATLGEIFRPGRFLRLVDPEGREAYGAITGVAVANPGPPEQWAVTVDPVPAMPVRETEAVCGCKLPCVGGLVNPVARVLYDIRSVAGHPRYGTLYNAAAHPDVAAFHKGQAAPARTAADDTEIDATLEVIAEYAVDLKFGLVRATTTAVTPFVTLERFPIGDTDVYTTANSLAGGGTPNRIRMVQVRLSVRAPQRDRDVSLPAPTTPVDDDPAASGLYRFSLGAGEGFARVRTLVADVSLPNLANMKW
jgi:hypothetical protein